MPGDDGPRPGRGSPPLLWVHAAPAEGTGLVGTPATVRRLGVGKTAAAIELTTALTESTPAGVITVGVAGVYPGTALAVGDACWVVDDRFVDEGVDTPDGFVSVRDLGLGEVGPFVASSRLARWADARLPGLPRVSGATVSTCSGVDRLSTVRGRLGVHVETMEGAAIALVCARFGIPWIQLRVISNRTGDRERAGWDLPRAFARLDEVVRKLATARPDGPFEED